MFYCPSCKNIRVYPEVTLKNIPAEFSINIFTTSIGLTLCSLGNYGDLDIVGYRCTRCGNSFQQEDLYVRSQLTGKIDKIDNFRIVSVKNKNETYVGGRVALVIPPKIIHVEEMDKFKEYNPYGNDKYLIIHKLSKIAISIPK